MQWLLNASSASISAPRTRWWPTWQGDRPCRHPGRGRFQSCAVNRGPGREWPARPARKYLIETPERVIYSVKRLMGRGVEEIQGRAEALPVSALPTTLKPGEVPRIKLGETALHAAGDFGVHSAPAQAQRRALLRRAGHARPSSPCPRTSTTRSARPPKTRAAWPASKFCAW
jgi:hypothetical protein